LLVFSQADRELGGNFFLARAALQLPLGPLSKIAPRILYSA
jgi:hypothetical protein